MLDGESSLDESGLYGLPDADDAGWLAVDDSGSTTPTTPGDTGSTGGTTPPAESTACNPTNVLRAEHDSL